jgi:hypothetical protein
MIKLVVGSNVKKETKIVSSDMTLRQAFEEAGINYAAGVSTLDGAALGPGDLDKSFAQHGITEKCFLYSVVKADNAMTF